MSTLIARTAADTDGIEAFVGTAVWLLLVIVLLGVVTAAFRIATKPGPSGANLRKSSNRGHGSAAPGWSLGSSSGGDDGSSGSFDCGDAGGGSGCSGGGE